MSNTGFNAQSKDGLLSNLRVADTLVVDRRIVTSELIATRKVDVASISTAGFQLTQEPPIGGFVMMCDSQGNGTWGQPEDIPNNVTGTGTTYKIPVWTNGPLSDLGDSCFNTTPGTGDITVDAGKDFTLNVTDPNGSLILNSAGTTPSALSLNAPNGQIYLDGQNISIISPTGGLFPIQIRNTGLGGILISAEGNATNAVIKLETQSPDSTAMSIHALAGGVDIRSYPPYSTVIKADLTPILTVGNPDVTVHEGDLKIYQVTKGLQHSTVADTTALQGSSNVTPVDINSFSGSITMFAVIPAVGMVGNPTAFQVNNGVVTTDSKIFLTVRATDGASFPTVASVASQGAGVFTINVWNTGSASTSEKPVIYFVVINPAL